MAPEVLQGGAYSEKVDVFSFGIMLYELMSQTVLARCGLVVGYAFGGRPLQARLVFY